LTQHSWPISLVSPAGPIVGHHEIPFRLVAKRPTLRRGDYWWRWTRRRSAWASGTDLPKCRPIRHWHPGWRFGKRRSR
jgi:hypothetical protein